MRLGRWRASLGRSQADLATQLGISQTLLSDIERGVARVTKLALAVRIEQLSSSWSEGAIRAADWVDEGHPQSVEASALAEQGR